ncbi:RagB/SusD family nutrient uptake outer membrane protein [Pedobacter borealis]|uniref:RagB/SusD family nutrient uptake outer membrane protein n=1 Tax=Pedobacter borealis TaxID=475254 RepID=UPI00049324F3|nr:RagB/SusD family nutrient uptake outer membrane protein [Pedobacter borealis]
MKYIHSLCIVILLFSNACKRDFLDVERKDALTIPTTFVQYDGFLAYSWQFYGAFPGYSNTIVDKDNNSDLISISQPNNRPNFIWQTYVIPATSDDYSGAYSRIRAINIMLDHIDGSTMSDVDKKHWRSVGYFFRAFNYAELINLYGDVSYVNRALTDGDTEELLSARTPRDQVAQNILSDLQYAETNIKPAGDGVNTINTNVVRALISRFGLREGTWRKYHSLQNADIYLRASATASEKLMTALPTLLPSYEQDFNSENLITGTTLAPGIILCKQYVATQITHAFSSNTRNSAGRYDLTKKAADMYLMADGQTRFTSPQFEGDQSPYTEFKNRDRRFLLTVPPPYKVTTPNTQSQTYTLTANAVESSYFAVMQAISTSQTKTLPNRNWNGFVVIQEPHFQDNNLGQPFSVTYTGYRFTKYYNQLITGQQGQDISDCPIFRMGEVLLNYAEAKYELSEFNQTITDQTINKLRARGGVQGLIITNIPNDPTRDVTVDPILWEIRRERAVELMGDGFRFDDLRRWKKMSYATERKLGRWIKKGVDVPANSVIPILNGATEGYIAYEQQPPSSFPDYYYLYPIPSNQTAINPKIIQNPGWK